MSDTATRAGQGTRMVRVIDQRRSRVLLAALVLSHLVVISRQVEVEGGTLFQQTLFALLSPVQAAVSGTLGFVHGTWSGYVGLRHAQAENQRLREELRALQTTLQRKQGKAQEVERLRELLGLREILPLQTVVAEVIASDGTPFYRTLTLGKGRLDGVDLNQAVISPQGVVGRVVLVGAHAARVQSILDKNSGVGARIERSRVTGVVSGPGPDVEAGSSDLVLKYIPALEDVVVGDVVVTSGLDRIYPKGLMVGRVRSVRTPSGLFKEILVTPAARLEQLDEVLVVQTARPDDTVSEKVQ